MTVAVAARQTDPANAAAKNELYAASVTRHGGDAIVLDANHPLAGQQVTFDLRVVSVRQATAEEIQVRRSAPRVDEE